MIFTKITILTRKNFEIQKLFFPWKPPWTKLFWLPAQCWSHENYSYQAKIRDEKIWISEMGKFQKKISLRSSTAPSDFWPKPMYLRTLWGVAIMMSPMPVLNLSDPIPTTGPFCGNSPVKLQHYFIDKFVNQSFITCFGFGTNFGLFSTVYRWDHCLSFCYILFVWVCIFWGRC